jgi:ferredoxin
MDTIDSATSAILKQHLIDPESCVRCGNCEEICPEKAITLGARNYVIDAAEVRRALDVDRGGDGQPGRWQGHVARVA